MSRLISLRASASLLLGGLLMAPSASARWPPDGPINVWQALSIRPDILSDAQPTSRPDFRPQIRPNIRSDSGRISGGFRADFVPIQANPDGKKVSEGIMGTS